MSKLLSFIILLILISNSLASQESYFDLMFPDKKVIKTGKNNVKEYLINLKDSLNLSKRDIKFRKFELQIIDEVQEVFLKDSSFFDDEFVNLLHEIKDQIIYQFEYRTNDTGSGFLFDFKFDIHGNLIKANYKYIHVVY